MNRGIVILILALGAAWASFAFTHRQQCGCCNAQEGFVRDGATRLPELAWLRSELHLDESQFAKVKELHLAHRPVCEALCKRIESSRRQVAELVAKGDTDSPGFSAALSDLATVEKDCRQALYRHINRTAAALTPEQARTYYRIVLPGLPSGECSPDSSSPHKP